MASSPWRDEFRRLFPNGITVRPTLIKGTNLFVDRLAVVRYLRAAHPDLSPEELIAYRAAGREAVGHSAGGLGS